MLIAQLDSTAVATWTIGVATVLTMIILAALGSYLGSVRSVNRIEVSVAELYGKLQKEMMTELSAMRADIVRIAATAVAMHDSVENIAKGNSPHIATINERLNNHDDRLDEHDQRLSRIQDEHVRQMGRGGCGK